MNGRCCERGSALIVVMVLVVVVAALASSIQHGSRSITRETLSERAAVQALQAADGGVELARWALHRDEGYRGEVITIGDAEVEVTVVPILSGRRWRVRSVARVHPSGPRGHAHGCTVEVELVAGGWGTEQVRWSQRP